MSLSSLIKRVIKAATPQGLRYAVTALKLRLRYHCTLRRLRRVYGKRKLVVAFCVSDVAKWKSQSLYEQLALTDTYQPIIFVYPSPFELDSARTEVASLVDDKKRFFADKGMHVISVWDSSSCRCVIPPASRPDILFYQQPWDTPEPFPLPSETSRYALSFYIPYFLVNNLELRLELGHALHRQVFRHVVHSEELAEYYDSQLNRRHYAGERIGLGHTIVDALTTKVATAEERYVIYAPHYSLPMPGVERPLTYSTFLDNGTLILSFAQRHPEIKWVFKPHPLLRGELLRTSVWSSAEVEAYYAAWERVGVVCETSDYIAHFQRSSAMITDCGSFLTEYSCMDKPLIRLYYHEDNLPPSPILEQLYGTFYYARDNAELQALLESVIIQHCDPHGSSRHEEVVRLGLSTSHASRNIIQYFDTLLS